MDWSRVDTRWWNLSLGVVMATAMSACGPTIMLDDEDGDTIADPGPDDLPPNTTFPPGGMCESDSDCDPNFVCFAGTCEPPPHDDHYDYYDDYCEFGCCYGECYYDDYECFDDSMCNAGQLCEGYDCQDVTTLPECGPVELVPLPLPEGEDSGTIVSLSFIDADGDGTDDLLVSRTDGAELHLGPGGEAPVEVALPEGDVIVDAAAGDFNGDGIADLSYTDGEDGVSILLGDGTGQFAHAFTVETPNAELRQVALDWNGDGLLDVAGLVDFGQVVIHQGDGTGALVAHYALPVADIHDSFAAGNFNGDAFDDLVVQDGSNGSMFLGNADGDLAQDHQLSWDWQPPYGRELLAGDIDGGGVAEVVGHTVKPNDWTLLETFRDQGETRYQYAIDGNPTEADLGDYDGDGALDVVLASSDALTFIHGRDSGGSTSVVDCQVQVYPDAPIERLAVGDLDGDGRVEIATADGSSLVVWATL